MIKRLYQKGDLIKFVDPFYEAKDDDFFTRDDIGIVLNDEVCEHFDVYWFSINGITEREIQCMGMSLLSRAKR